MIAAPLPLLSPLAGYVAQAEALLAEFRRGDAVALEHFHQHHPRFLDPVVSWKPRELADGELAAAAVDDNDARLAVARGYSFRDWAALADHALAVCTAGSAVRGFELAAEAVITGDVVELDRLLAADPALVRARSTRITCHDPPVHRATLLHYLGANGVEDYRQRSPANAVELGLRLLAAGADPDALAAMYGGEHTTLSMLASSGPPAAAGVQVPLIELLVDAGAAMTGSIVTTALSYGFVAAAEALVARGAAVDTLAIAAGLGRADDVARMLATAPADDRHAALSLAAALGRVEVVRLLLDAGEDPDRHNPPDLHPHSTPLHQAALAGHVDVVRLLIDRGARLELRDQLWNATPLGWARHNQQAEAARVLEAAEVARAARAGV